MEEMEGYAIGQQDFKSLRERNAIYVDKTAFIERIVKSKKQYYFLARPRRFGKSLFLSTLRYFFEGDRDLFKGLYIDSTYWKWEQYPVLYLDLNTNRYDEQGLLDDVINNIFIKWEKEYDVQTLALTHSQRFMNIIKAAREKTGKKVVILVDEYDKPLVGNLNKQDNFEHYRAQLASLYSNFKSASEYIELVFLTGVSRFSKLSIFSDLNNLSDITFSNAFADICGITERELLHYFKTGITALATKRRVSYEEACCMLKRNYDGYRFAPEGSDIYNPWSLLCAMDESRIGGYWNATGAASIVAEVLYKADLDIEKFMNTRWTLEALAGLDLRNADPTALLYQTGYLTIAEYDDENDTVKLKVPNDEVKKGLFNDLIPFYIKSKGMFPQQIAANIIDGIRYGEPEKMMVNLDAYMASIPYDLKMENENNFHNAVYVLLSLIGANVKAEAHTSQGRMDLLLETPKFVYIIELKYNASPEKALAQIDEKDYAHRFVADKRRIFKIGVCYSSKKRCISGWLIR